ncbi:MAG: hypothetical protein ACOVOX_11280, partial [Burkholderiaceae bacterium]
MKAYFQLGVLAAALTALSAQAQTATSPQINTSANPSSKGWEFGAVLDVAHTTRSLALGQREQG